MFPLVPNPTERVFGFRNDHVKMGQLVRELVMVKTAGNIADQWTQFGFRMVEATAWADTVAWAVTGQEIAAPVLGAVDPGDPANPTTTTVMMLPVHAKIAALFMRGVPVR
jgi:hypothetical protein